MAAIGGVVLANHRSCGMSGFSAEWLTLREPYDARARNASVLDAVAAAFAGRPSITIVDLACGTGSTMRSISARLPKQQTWRLIDNDLSLLARAAPLLQVIGQNVVTTPIDLARDLEAAFDGPLDLVTMSSLLDLVSTDWLQRLARQAIARALPVYAALTYDGRVTLTPHHPLDRKMVDSVNQHQRGDKGFGPALGPTAAAAAISCFETAGCVVVHGDSDWVFDANDDDIQLAFIAGLAEAAREDTGVSDADVNEWLKHRRDAIGSRRASIRVGHVDVFAQPINAR
jgi:hypothetical protein